MLIKRLTGADQLPDRCMCRAPPALGRGRGPPSSCAVVLPPAPSLLRVPAPGPLQGPPGPPKPRPSLHQGVGGGQRLPATTPRPSSGCGAEAPGHPAPGPRQGVGGAGVPATALLMWCHLVVQGSGTPVSGRDLEWCQPRCQPGPGNRAEKPGGAGGATPSLAPPREGCVVGAKGKPFGVTLLPQNYRAHAHGLGSAAS